jgi:hypothetical protein
MPANATKTPRKTKTQSFVRLNLDPNLDKMLLEYEQKYSLLSRSDIIRMLLSELYWSKKQAKKKQMVNFIESLPKPKNTFNEQEVFDIIDKWNQEN